MGKRSFIATTDGEVAALTLPELNGQIALLEMAHGKIWKIGLAAQIGTQKACLA
jgi:hypothetical protein